MYKIQQSRDLSGEVTIWWSKNAALPLIAASLLIDWKTTLTNVPDILDVHDFIHFLESLGCKIVFTDHTLEIDTTEVSLENIDTSMIARTRAGIYFIAWLLARFQTAEIPFPAGDKIGKRPIVEHVQGYRDMGFIEDKRGEKLYFEWPWATGEVTINAYFAVTATNNLIMGAASRNGTTIIELAAFEPHVFNLIDFLRQAGVSIDVKYDHTIVIHGQTQIQWDISQEVISDYLQSGTFAIVWALCAKEYIDIHRARIQDLSAFLYKLHEAGVVTQDLWNDTLRVYRTDNLQAVNIQTNIFPGFPTDLMPLFTVLMTQCDGVSRVFEILYEGRLNWLVEYERLGGNTRIINLHEAKIMGPTPLEGNTVNSWDLRSGAAMVVAWLVASWETTVENIYWIHRGYDNFLSKLQWLGAQITEIFE